LSRRSIHRFFPVAAVAAVTLTFRTSAAPAISSNPASNLGWFPPSAQVFEPLSADPRELQYAVRAVTPVGHSSLGEAAIGDYLGVYRFAIGADMVAQVSGGGGVFSRFELAAKGNDMQSADFFANVPFDIRSGSWSGRFMIFHTSSHLGDDYLTANGIRTEKRAWDSLRWLGSYDGPCNTRLYGGYTYAFRTLPHHLGRSAAQSGVEWKSSRTAEGPLQWFLATDMQWWQRSAWKPMMTSQAGLRLGRGSGETRGLTFFVEYTTGRRPEGQFFDQQESRWTLGTRFHLSS
jgi:hypothetical protein